MPPVCSVRPRAWQGQALEPWLAVPLPQAEALLQQGLRLRQRHSQPRLQGLPLPSPRAHRANRRHSLLLLLPQLSRLLHPPLPQRLRLPR